MTRNELSKSAMRIADEIYTHAAGRTNKELAEIVGLSASQFGRAIAANTDRFAAYLDAIGLTVCDKDAKPLSPSQLQALLVLSRDGIDNIEDGIFGK